MNVALYVRGENAGSVSKQLSQLREYAAHKRWNVVGEFRDYAVSGTPLNRTGLNQLRAQASLSPKPFDAVLVRNVDRLAREFLDLRTLISEFDAAGIKVLTVNEAGTDLMKMFRKLSLRGA